MSTFFSAAYSKLTSLTGRSNEANNAVETNQEAAVEAGHLQQFQDTVESHAELRARMDARSQSCAEFSSGALYAPLSAVGGLFVGAIATLPWNGLGGAGPIGGAIAGPLVYLKYNHSKANIAGVAAGFAAKGAAIVLNSYGLDGALGFALAFSPEIGALLVHVHATQQG